MDHGFSPLFTSSEVNADDHGNWTQDLGGHTAMSEWNPMSWFREVFFYSFWLFWCYWIKPKGHVIFFVGDDEMTRLFLGRFLRKNHLSRNSVHGDPHDVKDGSRDMCCPLGCFMARIHRRGWRPRFGVKLHPAFSKTSWDLTIGIFMEILEYGYDILTMNNY